MITRIRPRSLARWNIVEKCNEMLLNSLEPTASELSRRDAVMTAILAAIRENRTIKLPPFDASLSRPSDQVALQSIGLEPNAFSGTVGPFRYQFEGEEDLLHVIVVPQDSGPIRPEDARLVVEFLMPKLSPALIWLKPGEFTQHFYFGHDELLAVS